MEIIVRMILQERDTGLIKTEGDSMHKPLRLFERCKRPFVPLLFYNITFRFLWYSFAIGEPVSIEWFNPQGDRIVSSQRVVLQTESIRSRLTIYNANVEDAGIYRCQAANAKGQTQEATVVLEIYHVMFSLLLAI
ncbi:Neural cell adhesion molecule 2 [Acipenser ruthenus]|uniref:Neural cell adhesion molecule 2 n=1 Tax=Acipenser ruthenus TaxID=7906 RepID=A0A662YQ07_ACIRT|nr:Neural cell adhesion molecule 2 [Acipenser ruthenus]